MSNWSTKISVIQFQQNHTKKHASVPNSKVIENKSVRIVLHFLFCFHFFFSQQSLVRHVYFFFFQSLICFFYFLSLSGQLLILCLLLLSIAYEYPSFLSSFFFCLKISRVFFPKPPKLLLIQPTKFSPQNTSKSSPWILRTHDVAKTLRIS